MSDEPKKPQGPEAGKQAPESAAKTPGKEPAKGQGKAEGGAPAPKPEGKAAETKTAKPAQAKDKPERKAETKPAAGKARRSHVWLIVLVVLIIAAGAAGGGAWYLWQRLQHQDQAFGQRLSALQAQMQQARTDQRSATAELEQQLQAVREHQRAAQNAIEVLRAKSGRSEAEWLVAEAEYLMRIANDRLALARDVGTALTALQAADDRLRRAGDPALLGTRKQLADEIQALRSVDQPDLPGLSLSLGSLIGEVDKLPLNTPGSDKALEQAKQRAEAAQSATGAEGRGWRGVLKGIWHDLKSLVVIRHPKQATRPLLPPDERFFLTENLRLQLEEARLALMRGDAADYRQRIATAQGWLRTYFNTDAAATRGALETLAQLAKQNIRPKLPDISASLRLLERYRASLHPSQAPRPAATPSTHPSAPGKANPGNATPDNASPDNASPGNAAGGDAAAPKGATKPDQAH